jgi:hypothetical protein
LALLWAALLALLSLTFLTTFALALRFPLATFLAGLLAFLAACGLFARLALATSGALGIAIAGVSLSLLALTGARALALRVSLVARLGITRLAGSRLGAVLARFGILVERGRPGALATSRRARVRRSAARRLFARGLGDLVVDLLGEIFKLALGPLQGSRFITEHASRRPLDARAKALEPRARALRLLGRIFRNTQI